MNANCNLFISALLGVEKIVGWAVSHHFMSTLEASIADAKLVISSERYVINSTIT